MAQGARDVPRGPEARATFDRGGGWAGRPAALVDRAFAALDRFMVAPGEGEAAPLRAVAPPSPREGLRGIILLDRGLIVPLLVLAGLFLLCFLRQTDPDWWWHLQSGRDILANRAIPTADPYSYTVPGRPWVVHEWLFEVLSALAYPALGYAGLSLLMGLLILATHTLQYLLLRALGAGRTLAGGLLAWTAVVSFSAITMRPHLFSGLFLMIELWCLYLYRSGRRRAIWVLPPLTALWVNLHGAWIMGLGTLTLFILGEWLSTRMAMRRAGGAIPARDDRPAAGTSLWPALVVLALSVAAAALNPRGPAFLLFPFEFISPHSAMGRYSPEWQAPNFHEVAGLFFGLSVMALAVVGLRRPRPDYTLLLWALAFTFLGFSAERHLPLYALVVTPIVVQLLPNRGPERRAWGEERRAQGEECGTRGAGRGASRETALTGAINWALTGACAGALAVTLLGNPLAQTRREPNPTSYPVAGLAWLRAHPEAGRVFNNGKWGGYLIAELGGTRPVFVDSRVDLYGRDFLDDYFAVVELQPGWREVLRRHDVALVLMPKGSSLVAVLRDDPGWRVVLEGEEEALLERGARSAEWGAQSR